MVLVVVGSVLVCIGFFLINTNLSLLRTLKKELNAKNVVENNSESSKNVWVYFSIFSSIAIVISIVYYRYVTSEFKAPQNSSDFGDTFGGLSAIFAGLALVGVILTLIVQMDELILTRKELKNSSDALNNQFKSMELTTLLDSMNNFIKYSPTNSASDLSKKNAAKAILLLETEKLFNKEEYIGITRSEFIIFGRQHRTVNQKPNEREVTFELKNIGSATKEVKISTHGGFFEIETPVPQEQYNLVTTTVKFKFDTSIILQNAEIYQLSIEHVDAIIGNRYVQEITVKLKTRHLKRRSETVYESTITTPTLQ